MDPVTKMYLNRLTKNSVVIQALADAFEHHDQHEVAAELLHLSLDLATCAVHFEKALGGTGEASPEPSPTPQEATL